MADYEALDGLTEAMRRIQESSASQGQGFEDFARLLREAKRREYNTARRKAQAQAVSEWPLILKGDSREHHIEQVFHRAVAIGRFPGACPDGMDYLFIGDQQVSTRHAFLLPHQGSWWVSDNASTNGTWISRGPLAPWERLHEVTPLVRGDQIRIAHRIFTCIPAKW